MSAGPSARLVRTHLPRDPDGLVLVLHGGAARGDESAVSATQPSVLRMIPTARRVALAGRRRLAVFRLLNSARGWDSQHTPVDDVAWALGELEGRLGPLPVSLVGHSLGGRAALLSAGRPAVRSVVALAPWVYPDDVAEAPGRAVLVVHGDQDRVASAARSEAVARRMARSAGPVGYVCVEGGKHAMLRRGGVFDGLAAGFAATTLLDLPPRGVVGRVLAGETSITI